MDVLHGARILAAVRRHFPKRLAALLAVVLLVVAGIPDLERHAAGAEAPLRYLGGPAGTLDPVFIADASDVQLLLQLYAGLTRLDEKGEPYPSLAASWQVSTDRMTYTFDLRSGLRFSDGSRLDAADVRRSWLRLLDPATHASAPDVLTVIKGAAERLAGGPEAAVGIEAPDPQRLVVRLRHPAAYFPSITATPTTFVVPRNATPSRDWQQPTGFIGSGPYVVERSDGNDLLLRANAQYVAGPPPIAQVRWIAAVDGDPVEAFSRDQLDLVNISSADAGWIAYDRQLGTHLHQAAALNVQYFGFDTRVPPFNDVRVRRAFALALDRPRLVELAAGSAQQAASSIVPPALQPEGFPHDRAGNVPEARRLLDEAGYADRSKLGTIVVNGTGLDAAPAVATWEHQLGVKMAVETMRFGDYLSDVERDAPAIFTINWVADYASPHALYSLLLAPDAASNYGRWSDPQFVQLLDAAADADGANAQAGAYRAVDQRVDDQAPVIPWSYDTGWWLSAGRLRGLGNLTIGLLDFGRVSWDS